MAEIKRVIVVTGANKGIGYEIVNALRNNPRDMIVLCCRDEARGRSALDSLGKPANVSFVQLDVRDDASVTRAAQTIKSKYGRVDVLVNNAGIMYLGDTFGAEEARNTIDTNTYGTTRVCEAFRPLLKPGSRVINVASTIGLLTELENKQLKERFISPTLKKEDVVALMEEFIRLIPGNAHLAAGWPNSMYMVSKMGQIAYTRIIAREWAAQGVRVVSCCPGYCATDLTGWGGMKTAKQGSEVVIWLANTLSDEQFARANGYQFYEMKQQKWYQEEPTVRL